MTMIPRRYGLMIAAAGAITLAGAIPSSAAPVMSSTTGVKAAVTDNIVDVRWRRGWGGVGAGLAAGALLGAGIAAATAPPYYYGPAYGYPAYGAYAYEAPVVYGGPTYAPAYGYGYAPAYGYGRYYGYGYQTCAVDGGYGRTDYSNC
jgi:hypothetical protein